MREFTNANLRKIWPTNTKICCYWCAHPFRGPPVAIPRFYRDDVFYVFGCFCSYSCAASYLFDKASIPESEKHRSFQWLHLLRKKIVPNDNLVKNGTVPPIPLAPPKELLRMFGGELSIKVYRAMSSTTHAHYSVYSIVGPNILSIVPTVEMCKTDKNKLVKTITNNDKWTFQDKQLFIPLDKNRVLQAKKREMQKLNEERCKQKSTRISNLSQYITILSGS